MLLAAILAAVPGPVHGQDYVVRARAQTHVDLGAKFFESKDYAAAIDEFQRADKLIPLPDYTYYIARCYEEMGEHEAALAHYDKYLTVSDDEGRADRARQAVERIVETHYGTILVTCTPAEAVVRLVGIGEGPCPVRHDRVPPGAYSLFVEAKDHAPLARRVEVAAGVESEIPVWLEPANGTAPALAPAAAGRPPPDEVRASRPPPSPRPAGATVPISGHGVPLALAGGGGVMAAVTALLLVLAESSENDADALDLRADGMVRSGRHKEMAGADAVYDEADDAYGAARSLRTASVLTGAVALAFAAAAVWLWPADGEEASGAGVWPWAGGVDQRGSGAAFRLSY